MSYEPLAGAHRSFRTRTPPSSSTSFLAEPSVEDHHEESEEGRLLRDEEKQSSKIIRQSTSLCSSFSSRWRNCAPSMGPLQQAYLALLALQGVLVVGLLTATMGVVANRAETWGAGSLKTLYLYLAIFVFAEFFQLFLAVDGFRHKSIPQLYGVSLISLSMLIYAALLPRQLREGLSNTFLSECYRVGNSNESCKDSEESSVYHAVKGLLLAAPVSIGVINCLAVAVLPRIQAQRGWRVCKRSRLSKQHFYQQCLLAAIKLDMFFLIVFVVQLVLFGLFARGVEDLQFDYTILLVVPIVVSCVLGTVSVQRAHRDGLVAFAVSHALITAYVARKLWNVFTYEAEHDFSPYIQHQACLALFAVLALLCAAGTWFLGLRVYLHQRVSRGT